jgi:hypothetical protein
MSAPPLPDLSRQRPLLVWGPDAEAVRAARDACAEAGLFAGGVLHGAAYSVFCAYAEAPLPADLDAKLRALASHVQVSLRRTGD